MCGRFTVQFLLIGLRTILAFVVLFLLARIMGIRQISQLTFYDYITGITIGSVAAQMAVDDSIPLLYFLVALILFALLTLGISIVTTKNIRARKFLSGTPSVLVYKGQIIEQNLKDRHYDVNDLLAACRKSGYFNISDVAYAIMEMDGTLSILPKTEKRPVTTEDINLSLPQEHLCSHVIIDGKMFEKNLRSVGRDIPWLNKQLEIQKQNLCDVLLGVVDQQGNLSLFLKNQSLQPKDYFI